MLTHSYNYASPLCKCTQPNIHSEIVSGQLPPNTCNTKGRVYPHKSSPTHHIFTKILLASVQFSSGKILCQSSLGMRMKALRSSCVHPRIHHCFVECYFDPWGWNGGGWG